jgi:hypothetical protein
MVRIPGDGAQPVVAESEPRQKPRGQGRLVKQGTVLAREMTRRNMRKIRVAAVVLGPSAVQLPRTTETHPAAESRRAL